jgi:hypothetical protein
MDNSIILMMMRSFGISKTAVKFDADKKLIELRYTYLGQEQIQNISFEQAETFFRDMK